MARLIWSVAIGFVLFAVSPNTVFAQVRLASAFGEANIGGQRVFVHVTVAVPPGLDGISVAEDAVRGQGARPIQSVAFSLTGLDWNNADGFPNLVTSLPQSHNFSDLPDSLSDQAVEALVNSQGTWDIGTSVFSFFNGGSTNRCPSLAKQCPGRQRADQLNDVGFGSIRGCCTLAATWFLNGSSDIKDEPDDIVVNNLFNWDSADSNWDGVDLETVLLHENGHALGLGHSSVSEAVMVATYVDERRNLRTDDMRGVTYLYPAVGSVGSIKGVVTDNNQQPQDIPNARVSIADLPVSDTTDDNGDYLLTGVPIIGTYSVTASAENFKSLTQPVTPAGLVTVLDFALAPDSGGNGGGKPKCKKNGRFANCP